MAIPSELNALIERLNQELDTIEREATAGLNLARVSMERFPNNFTLVQLFAFLNTSMFFAETSRRRIQVSVEYLSANDVIIEEKIQEVGEDLAIELGQVLETKITVGRVKTRLENLQ
ncbi:restriction endonuclease subunit S [Planktothrix sp. FACHB-1355]|uniref:Restriction endonuclease subunit S n=1 Tax=Aerosakkonema funiforme FACHB-1375 TaxID=2949571 RepID=A0A926VLT9_9CYAN|nr:MULTISPECIES: restriction endonuclease subunit S [Oscillatoriales]MBD2185157.1 restriction endonuclease subunit S [Aerosakkonema funiforme FACHB-1375]MBD3562363.1 restriction endonuclease subunit S [Planktothrix sp. FACHB-1355]